MNSFDEARQDALAGKKGAFHIIHNALGNLKGAGYPAKDAFLALSTVICRQNRDELTGLWTWIRDNNMAPYFEIITPQGQAKNNATLELVITSYSIHYTKLYDHAGCVWSQRFFGIVAFPVGFDKRVIYNPTVEHKDYAARVIPQYQTHGTLGFDIWITDNQGDLCETVSGVMMRDVSGGTITPPAWIREGIQ